MKKVVVILVFLAACGSPTEPLPRQDDALAIIWAHYGAAGESYPGIAWRYDDCPKGWGYCAKRWDGRVFASYYVPDWDLIEAGASLYPEEKPFSATGLAHEMMHALQERRGYRDERHEIRDDWWMVPGAQQALRDAGL